jgi:cytoskeletal protein RodZ
MEPAETYESPGKYLRTIRESQGLSLIKVADATRIREPVLTALEGDRYGNLPPLYVKSFLRAYAECLGLDPSEVMTIHQRYTAKLSFSKGQGLNHPSATRSQKANARLLVISVSAFFLMALIFCAFIILLR